MTHASTRVKRLVALIMTLILVIGLCPWASLPSRAFGDESQSAHSEEFAEQFLEPSAPSDESIVAGSLIVRAHHNGDNAQEVIAQVKALAEPYELKDCNVIAENGYENNALLALEIADDARVDALIATLNSVDGVVAEREHQTKLVDDVPESFDVELDDFEIAPIGADNADIATVDEPNPASAVYPNDPLFPTQHEHFSYAEAYGANLTEAWSYLGGEDNDTTIAILDTAVNYTHEDLEDNILTDLMGTTINGKYQHAFFETGSHVDYRLHGTYVSGIASAVTNNGFGMAGAAYNAKLLPIQVYDPLLTTDDSWVIAALQYIDDLIESGRVPNIRAIVMSFAGTAPMLTITTDMIEHLAEEHNVLSVAGGGNGDENYIGRTVKVYPSDYDCVLGVTALGIDGSDCVWSDYNECKDITAPGESLRVPYYASNTEFVGMDGTSGSAPLTAGAASVMYSVVKDLTPAEVRTYMQETAVSLAGTKNYRGDKTGSPGALDAGAAVALAVERRGLTRVAIPEPSELTYTGAEQHGFSAGTGYSIISGNTATDAGEHLATLRLDPGCKWSDGSVADKQLSWTIAPAPVNITVDGLLQTITLEESQSHSVQTAVHYDGDGKLSVSTADPSIAAAAIEDGTLTITGHAAGETFLTIKAEGERNTKAAGEVTVMVIVDDVVGDPNAPLYAMFYKPDSVVFQRGETPYPSYGEVTSWFTDFEYPQEKEFLSLKSYAFDLKRVIVRDAFKAPVDLTNLFGQSTIESITGLGKIDTSETQNFYGLFSNSGLKSLDLSTFNTAKATNMTNMFRGCSALSSVNLTGWNTAAVTDMASMFENSGVTSLDLSSFTIGKDTNTEGMFKGCDQLERITVGSGFEFHRLGYLPETTRWKNTATGRVYEAKDIPAHVAATYVRTTDSADDPSEPDDPDIPDDPTAPVPVYRLFDKVTGEHLYTTDQNEVDALKANAAEWDYEGVKWYGPSEGTPVYRLFNRLNGEHLYTCDPNEKAVLLASGDWTVDRQDRPMFYSFEEGDSGAVPVYRLYNANQRPEGAHLWTLDANEVSVLSSPENGWTDEGVKFYAIPVKK